MHQSIDGCRRGQRVFKDALPFREDEVAGQQHAAAFVAMGQQREQYFHLLAALLHIAQVIDDQSREAIQPLQFFLQPESRFGQKQPLHQQYAGSEINGVTLLDQLMAQGAQKMRFPATGIPEHEDILSPGQKVTVK